MSEPRWLARREIDGAPAFQVGVIAADTLVAEWVGAARLTCDRTGGNAELVCEPGIGPLARKKIEGASAMLLRQVAGRLAFHASCIEIAGRAVLLTGRSGAGKSTLAAWLVANGAAMISDDLTPVDQAADEASADRWVAQPFETTSWLDAASSDLLGRAHAPGAAKQPLPAARLATGAPPLAGILDLVFDDERAAPRLVPLGGMDAIGILLPQTIRFVIDESDRQQRELDALIALVTRVPVLRLERRRDFNGFGAVRALIDGWIGTGRHE